MIVKRIIQYLKRKKIAVSAFEKELGLGNVTLSKAYNSGGAIGSDKIEKIVSVCKDLSPVWLLTGEGDMIIDKSKGEEEQSSLPLVPREALAHTGAPAFKPEELNRRSDFLVRAKGDYMMPKYNGGDLIACRYVRDLLYFQWGRLYFIATKTQGEFIRRIRPADEPDKITCCADNNNYEPFDIPKSDILSLALVKGAVTFE